LIIECVFQIQQMQNPTAMLEILEPHLPEKQRQMGTGGSYTAGYSDHFPAYLFLLKEVE